ncbi:MAG: nickel pincer cofactor biosynthesis protein LarB [Planctomycetes bacterium]|nr:nickel pincer cofactor biosynthesis protein LarB [Planctomycetota bacterium]
MDRAEVLRILEAVRRGALAPEAALEAVAGPRAEDLGFAVVDHGRGLRCGFPEVILAQGKTPAQVAAIAECVWARSGKLLCTRADRAVFEAVRACVPEAHYEAEARVIQAAREPSGPGVGRVMVVSAGTADVPVAEEARLTAAMLGARVETCYDVGVAGLHRLLDRVEALRAARALIVVAGMEGALPSVVGGLVDRPVVAVPTSVGYGAGFGGLSALLGMLNSCAANVCVVNIDNGFGAGFVAALINRGDPAPAGPAHRCG